MSDQRRMQKLMLIAASLMSREEIITKLKEDIAKYETASGEEKKKAYTIVEGDCLLLATKKVTDNESIEDIEKTMKSISSMVDLMEQDKRNQK